MPTVRHADYIGSWLDVLREDNRAIVRAASQASKAADWLLGFAPDTNLGMTDDEREAPDPLKPEKRQCGFPAFHCSVSVALLSLRKRAALRFVTGSGSREGSRPVAETTTMAPAVQKLTLSPSRDIPFNKLVLSQSNVRRVKSGVSVEELAELSPAAARSSRASMSARPRCRWQRDRHVRGARRRSALPGARAAGEAEAPDQDLAGAPASCVIQRRRSSPRTTAWLKHAARRAPSS